MVEPLTLSLKYRTATSIANILLKIMIGILPITFLICIIWIFNHSKKLHDLSRYNRTIFSFSLTVQSGLPSEEYVLYNKYCLHHDDNVLRTK